MTALFFLVPLNVLIIALLVFLFFAFSKEKNGEKDIRKQLETIKTAYDAKAKEYDAEIAAAKSEADQALKQSQEKEASCKMVTDECNSKMQAMQDEMQKKMDEVQHIEDSLKDEASERIKQFEQQQKEDVEKNMVSLVMNVTKKILEKTLTYEEHKEIIKKSIDEIKFQD